MTKSQNNKATKKAHKLFLEKLLVRTRTDNVKPFEQEVQATGT